MNMNFNPEEGFLTQPLGHEAKSAQEAIVLVAPAAGSNVITMYNVEEFISKGRYVPSEEIRKVRVAARREA